MPGWAQAAPLQRLMRMFAEHRPGRSDRQAEAALAFAGRLKEAEALYFKVNQQLPARMERLPKQNKQYLAHEYLNEWWNAPYHADVAREMAAAKLSFVASATLAENFDGVVLNEAMRKVLAEIDDPVLVQTLRDYCFNQQFRRDIYLRGQPLVVAGEQRQRTFSLPYVLTVARKDLKLEFQLPMGKAKGTPAIYEPVADALSSESGATLAQIGAADPQWRRLHLCRRGAARQRPEREHAADGGAAGGDGLRRRQSGRGHGRAEGLGGAQAPWPIAGQGRAADSRRRRRHRGSEAADRPLRRRDAAGLAQARRLSRAARR